MKYLFIGAHPDDIEYACAGTIMRMRADGDDVKMLVLSHGGASEGRSEERKMEAQVSAWELSVDLELLTMQDGHISIDAHSVDRIKRVIDRYDPDCVFVHYPDDTHQDHRAAAQITLSAAKCRGIMFYQSFSAINFSPDTFISIDDYNAAKWQILGIHKSQIEKYEKRGVPFAEKAMTQNILHGMEAGCKYAEAYKTYRKVVM